MPSENGPDPVDDGEIVYRRVPESTGWCDPQRDRPVLWQAFKPHANDVSGLSVWRGKSRSAAKAAASGARPGKRYFVLALRVDRLRQIGVQVIPSPREGGEGHATLINLSSTVYERDKNSVRELAEKIANNLVESIEGPFGPFET